MGKRKARAGAENKELEMQGRTQSQADRSDAIKKFAEEQGLDEELVKGLINIVEEGHISQLRKEIEDLKGTLQKSKEEAEIMRQNRLFEKEFEKEVLPLLEQEGVADKKNEIMETLRALAFTEEYARTPLKVIYRGDETFETFRRKGKKSAESGGRMTHAGEDREKSITEMSEEEFEKWSDEQGKKYSRYLERK